MLTMKNQTKIPLHLFMVYVEMGVHVMVHVWGQRATCKGCFSSTMWVLEMEPRLSAVPLSTEPSHSPDGPFSRFAPDRIMVASSIVLGSPGSFKLSY